MKRFLCKAFTAAIVPLILLAGPAAADEPLRATSITASSTLEAAKTQFHGLSVLGVSCRNGPDRRRDLYRLSEITRHFLPEQCPDQAADHDGYHCLQRGRDL